MDDIDQDIQRAQFGRRKEVAYEIINHPIKSKTNLPPLHLHKEIRRPKKGFSKDFCEYKIVINGKETTCGKPTTNYCKQCKQCLCFEHRRQKDHNCPNPSFYDM